MNIVVDIGHPAEVHYFKNLIYRLTEKNHSVSVLARNKEVTFDLLNEYNIPFTDKGRGGSGFFDRALYVIKSLKIMNSTLRSFKPVLCISHASPYLAFAAARRNIPHVMFNDTERAPLFRFVVSWCKPSAYSPDAFLRKDIPGLMYFPSYMELAYLHPDLFEPDASVKEITGDKYVLLRFVANKATHDIGINHLDTAFKRELVQKASRFGNVWISSEGPLPAGLEKYRLTVPPGKIHDVIAHASLLAGDSATMTTEAAVLGIPSVFISDNRWGYIKELEEKYRLVHYFTNNETNRKQALEKVVSILETGSRGAYLAAREQLLREKKNMTQIMEEIIESTVPGFLQEPGTTGKQ
jgi:uncharacterized protein